MAIVRNTFIVLYGLAFCEEPSSFVSITLLARSKEK